MQVAPTPRAERLYLVGRPPYALETDEASARGYVPPCCHGCLRVWESPQHKPFDHGVECELRRRLGVAHHGFDIETLIGRSCAQALEHPRREIEGRDLVAETGQQHRER